jgi:hypothetical protein
MPDLLEKEKEPMLLLDTTGSMSYRAAEGSEFTRRDVIREAIGLIVTGLQSDDSQAEHEANGGGLRTVTFAGGYAHDLEDLNTGNWKDKWNSIRWGGSTQIMPGFNTMLRVYLDEFGAKDQDERPTLMGLIITDGEAEDTSEFQAALKRAKNDMYCVVAIIGFGAEHDSALKNYQAIEAANSSHVKVVSFDSETDPHVIAEKLQKMIA